jgi:hypothetical protein
MNSSSIVKYIKLLLLYVRITNRLTTPVYMGLVGRLLEGLLVKALVLALLLWSPTGSVIGLLKPLRKTKLLRLVTVVCGYITQLVSSGIVLDIRRIYSVHLIRALVYIVLILG